MNTITKNTLLILFFLLTSYGFTQEKSVETKIDNLIQQMTLEEKIGQLIQIVGSQNLTRELVSSGKVGSVLGLSSAKEVNKWQKIAVEDSRLGIPIIVAHDVIHGYHTTFPIPLAETASWNPELVKKASSYAAYEAAKEGIHWTYAPMVDIARDPRWGRVIEGSGEDPYLGSAMAVARVEGFQGDDCSAQDKLVATAKHFAAYGAAEAGRDYNTVDLSERTLRNIYLTPFKAAVDAGVGSIMSAFNDLNGVPASANHFILTEILRNEWDFQGTVVSDYNSLGELVFHGFAKDKEEAALRGLTAGVDIDMVGNKNEGDVYEPHLKNLVIDKKLNESEIDRAVRNVLRMKFNAGLFDKPYVDVNYFEDNKINQSEINETALKIAKESIVLLKNENNLLPLNKNLKNIAVIGELSDSEYDQLGAWTAKPNYENSVTCLEGIKEIVSENSEVIYSRGYALRPDSVDKFDEAINIAKKSDLVIFFAGEDKEVSGEAASKVNLDLPDNQTKLLSAIKDTDIPVVVVLINGRPLTLSWLDANFPAIVESWQLGDMHGKAIAEVLFGDYNPSGKLPITFPRNVGQIPLYYNYKSSGRPISKEDKFTSKYLDSPNSPLFPFGYGLSYTTFNYADMTINNDSVSIQENIVVRAKLKNIGDYSGEEIVQLYVQDISACVTRPVKELKGFQKITLTPGEEAKVEFTITPEMLSFYNAEMEKINEAGLFKIMIGGNSEELLSKQIYVYE